MSTVASTVLRGDAAFLVAAQAELLSTSLGCEIYRLKTSELRLGMYDPLSRRLVIIDAAALAALASAEAIEHRELSPEAEGQITTVQQLLNARRFATNGGSDPEGHTAARATDPISHA